MGLNFTIDMTWGCLIMLNLSKEWPKNQSPDTRGAGYLWLSQCTVAPAAFWKCLFLGHPVCKIWIREAGLIGLDWKVKMLWKRPETAAKTVSSRRESGSYETKNNLWWQPNICTVIHIILFVFCIFVVLVFFLCIPLSHVVDGKSTYTSGVTRL